MYLHILKDWKFFVEEYDRLLLSQSVIFLLSYHGASVYLYILEDWEFLLKSMTDFYYRNL